MNQVFHQTIFAENVTNNTFYLSELEQIVFDHISASNCTDRDKAKLLELVKSTGIQEVVKNVVQKVPDLSKFLVDLLN